VLAAASTCLELGVRRGDRRYNKNTLDFAIADLASHDD
jgi:hypothetical protein